MHPIFVITRLTLVETVRRRIATAALIVGSGFLLFFGTGLHFIHKDIQAHVQTHGPNAFAQAAAMSVIVMAGLYAGTFLAMMASVVFALDTLAGEIGSGVLETLCTKPIRRVSILMGKWLGCAALVAGYTAFLLGGVLLIARLISGFQPPHVLQGLLLILFEGLLLMTLALACGTRLSPLASGMVVFGLYGLAFIGAWIEQIGTMLGNTTARSVGIVASLLMPSESLWRLASHLMQPALVRDVGLSPFTVASVPSAAMVLWAIAYTLVTLAVALRLLSTRDL
jgi:ABC-type transport system involved in multi-copper enzyme maturation permease subunit